jgi:hypothetical protein
MWASIQAQSRYLGRAPAMIDSRNNAVDDPERSRAKETIKTLARVIGLCGVAFVVLAQAGFGPSYLDPAGKALFGTGIVFVSIFFLNRDVFRFRSGQMLGMLFLTLHVLLILHTFRRLQEISFIVLAPICLVECVAFTLPLMLIRKRHSGIWY